MEQCAQGREIDEVARVRDNDERVKLEESSVAGAADEAKLRRS
jgi:hypothetical protein